MQDYVEMLTNLDDAVKYGNQRELVSVMKEVSEIVGIEYISDYDLWRQELVKVMQGGS